MLKHLEQHGTKDTQDHSALVVFLFFPTKNITTTEGGMLTTNDKKRYEEIKRLIAHGINKDKRNFIGIESQIYQVIILDCPII